MYIYFNLILIFEYEKKSFKHKKIGTREVYGNY